MLGVYASTGPSVGLPPNGDVLFEADWADGVAGEATLPMVSPFTEIVKSNAADHVRFVSSPAAPQGGLSVDLECGVGSPRVHLSTVGNPKFSLAMATEYWIYLRLFLPSLALLPNITDWRIMWQCKPSNNPGNPSPQISLGLLSDGKMYFRTRGGEVPSSIVNGQVVYGPAPQTSGNMMLTTAAATRDVWHDVLMHIELSAVAGITEVWHKLAGGAFPDPGPAVSYYGPNTYSTSGGAVLYGALYLIPTIYRSGTDSGAVNHIGIGGVRVATGRIAAEGLWT